MFNIDEIKDNNVQEWVVKNLKEWEEIKTYPGKTMAQYDWWMNFIYRIIWAYQSDKEIKDLLSSPNLKIPPNIGKGSKLEDGKTK